MSRYLAPKGWKALKILKLISNGRYSLDEYEIVFGANSGGDGSNLSCYLLVTYWIKCVYLFSQDVWQTHTWSGPLTFLGLVVVIHLKVIFVRWSLYSADWMCLVSWAFSDWVYSFQVFQLLSIVTGIFWGSIKLLTQNMVGLDEPGYCTCPAHSMEIVFLVTSDPSTKAIEKWMYRGEIWKMWYESTVTWAIKKWLCMYEMEIVILVNLCIVNLDCCISTIPKEIAGPNIIQAGVVFRLVEMCGSVFIKHVPWQ